MNLLKMFLRVSNLIFFISSITSSVDAVEWVSGNEGQISWSFNCDFNGGDIGSQKGRGEDCGNICIARQDCTRFTWTDYEGGTCWLKSGDAQAVDAQNNGVCGQVINRGSNGNINWVTSDGGQIRWAFNCDFNGGDIGNQKGRGEDCGNICLARQDCTRFSWTDYEGGTCWLKNGDAQVKGSTGVCGQVLNRHTSTLAESGTVKGTFWAQSSDSGGCQVPQGDYRITDAIALGQQPELGPLVWRQGLCGQVLDVDCGNGRVPAVVVSTCNLGSGSCGVDMIAKTWNKATNNEQPGIVTCKVSLSSTNPLNEDRMLCYHRPNSELNNAYYTIVGVINTSGKIPSKATLSGKEGVRRNDGWFEFDGQGQSLFNGDSTVTFDFEGGGSNSFKLSDCRDGKQTQIFQ